jgi:glycosyltransferase involved in cell wall biosynthesis
MYPKPLISVILPAFNEIESIEHTICAVSAQMMEQNTQYEIIVVDDGSSDGTYEMLQWLSLQHKALKAIRLSRNFGKEAALFTGLNAANGEAIITMDSDLQHPPETITLMIEAWRQGFAVVHAVKNERKSDSFIARWRAAAFNFLFEILGGVNLKDASDFILLDRAVKDVIIHRLPERMRFYRGLTHWVGFKQTIVHFDVAQRWDKSRSRWTWTSLFNLATTALVSFTTTPLRIIAVLGSATLLIGSFIGVEALVSWFLGRAVSGFVTIIGTLLIIGSFIMISLGIIGEYIAKIYEETKARPPGIIETSFGFETLTIENNKIKNGNHNFETSFQINA